jgi:hypothetical protein
LAPLAIPSGLREVLACTLITSHVYLVMTHVSAQCTAPQHSPTKPKVGELVMDLDILKEATNGHPSWRQMRDA